MDGMMLLSGSVCSPSIFGTLIHGNWVHVNDDRNLGEDRQHEGQGGEEIFNGSLPLLKDNGENPQIRRLVTTIADTR